MHAILHLSLNSSHRISFLAAPSYPTLVVVGGGGDIRLLSFEEVLQVNMVLNVHRRTGEGVLK